ncbi:hypothetical protein AYI68_g3908 [Smittium mucronatum]|uniref:Uncharacterized protein n=1 Tax=Smittium mucronatum TaxID=133383 RepID=A0A1R0GYL4_9FUNG|nr:hypothetical protein AYI68_g3908 [Smittium mucronatum]
MSQDGNIQNNTNTPLAWAQDILLRFAQMEAQRQAIDIVIDDNHIDNYVVYRALAKNLRLYQNFPAPSHPFKKTSSVHLPPTWSAISFWYPAQ